MESKDRSARKPAPAKRAAPARKPAKKGGTTLTHPDGSLDITTSDPGTVIKLQHEGWKTKK